MAKNKIKLRRFSLVEVMLSALILGISIVYIYSSLVISQFNATNSRLKERATMLLNKEADFYRFTPYENISDGTISKTGYLHRFNNGNSSAYPYVMDVEVDNRGSYKDINISLQWTLLETKIISFTVKRSMY